MSTENEKAAAVAHELGEHLVTGCQRIIGAFTPCNYVSFGLRNKETGVQYEITIRDASAKTPHQLVLEARAQRDALLEELENMVAQHGCDCGHQACKRCDDTTRVRAAIAQAKPEVAP